MVTHVFELYENPGRSSDGFVVPLEGGCLCEKDDDGNLEFWVGHTNYPAPYWNRWGWTRRVGEVVEGPKYFWWYGQWASRRVVTRS